MRVSPLLSALADSEERIDEVDRFVKRLAASGALEVYAA